MVNKQLFFFVFLVLLFFTPQNMAAQFIPGEENEEVAVVYYRKMGDDTLRMRKSKIEPKKKRKTAIAASDSLKPKRAVAKKKSTPKRVQKSRVYKVDSVEYEAEPYRLGDRIIMRGDSGADVRTVASILVKKLYMDEDSIIYLENGDVLYEGELVRSVIRFQRLNGMHPDGIVGSALIKALRKRKN